MNSRKPYLVDPKVAEWHGSSQYLSAIIENSHDGIYITDQAANTLQINGAYEVISGLKRKDVMGKNMRELVDNGIVSQSGTLLAIERKASVTLEQAFKTGKTALITSTPIFDETGNIVLVVTNVRDVTELYELREQLRRSKKLTHRMNSELEVLRNSLLDAKDIISVDKNMNRVLQIACKVAQVDSTVLITGETGVGKEKVSAFIHKNSQRKDNKYLKINCGAIPPGLIESELFGYEKGAFTGANREGKPGIFELANEGTLFLDEIGELPFNMQVKLLRVLQEQEVERIGSIKTRKVNVRVIAATNQDLESMVKKRQFRQDLYYRLNVFPIHIPPLRERRDDIIPFIQFFLQELNNKYSTNYRLDAQSYQWAVKYSWPGNVRELRNLVERSMVLCVDETIRMHELEAKHPGKADTVEIDTPDDHIKLKEILGNIELEYINKAYKIHGNVRDAAACLDMEPSTFVRKRKKLYESTG